MESTQSKEETLQELRRADCLLTAQTWLQDEIARTRDTPYSKQIKRYIELVIDHYLPRFCDLYKYKTDQVIKGLQATLKWRVENKIYDILQDFKYDEWDAVQQCCPYGYHGLTKSQHPVFIQRVGLIDADKLKKSTNRESFIKRCY